jgi:hypothetical protein
MICSAHDIRSGEECKENEMGGAGNTHGETINAYRVQDVTRTDCTSISNTL